MEWNEIFKEFKGLNVILEKVEKERKKSNVLPPKGYVFNAFKKTPFEEIKVVILGQDPYPNINDAMGMSFSVQRKDKLPKSLSNIFKELECQYGSKPKTGDLSFWAEQGVFLLNSTLTVEEGKPDSHRHLEWEKFTDFIIEKISKNKENIVFLLWGNNARKKRVLIDSKKHLILESPHPSPLSAYRGFFGSNHFEKTNSFLLEKGKNEIKWI